MSGLPLMRELDAMAATTRGLGEVIAPAVDAGATRLVVGLGGSASTDGGAGALVALGLGLADELGDRVPDGGGHLRAIAARRHRWPAHAARGHAAAPTSPLRCSDRRAPPPCSARRRAQTPIQVVQLDDALAHFAEMLAGGTARRSDGRGHRRRGRRGFRLPGRVRRAHRIRVPTSSPSSPGSTSRSPTPTCCSPARALRRPVAHRQGRRPAARARGEVGRGRGVIAGQVTATDRRVDGIPRRPRRLGRGRDGRPARWLHDAGAEPRATLGEAQSLAAVHSRGTRRARGRRRPGRCPTAAATGCARAASRSTRPCPSSAP